MDTTDYDSEFSDEDSLGSMLSEESSLSRTSVPDSEAGQIWGMLCSLDDLVLEVKVRYLPVCAPRVLSRESPAADGSSRR